LPQARLMFKQYKNKAVHYYQKLSVGWQTLLLATTFCFFSFLFWAVLYHYKDTDPVGTCSWYCREKGKAGKIVPTYESSRLVGSRSQPGGEHSCVCY
jgi:hypothetical protein